MPHKHTRREQDPSTFDLPPSQIARPLPVKSQSKQEGSTQDNNKDDGKNLKRKRDTGNRNDTPRAFKRLMAYAGGKKTRSGLDDGRISSAKGKKKSNNKSDEDEVAAPQQAIKPELPKIRPGERMSEFVARVDAALPVGGLINKTARDGKDPLGMKVWRTKKERQMHKLYDEWREEERKIQEQREEELELLAEKELEDEEAGVSWKLSMEQASAIGATSATGATGKKKKKGKRTKYLGEAAGAEEDPWEELRRKRGETRPGLSDVAKAPPELNMKLPKKLTVRGATVAVDNVPKAAGSLRRREELQEVREDVVASYRRYMEGKRPSLRR
ncbi:hypothetical protein BX600DRAFT_550343 [Xylariales sp. PMI_506]|nr:hypothetical protein BX600DRAFT_550343 [Xylariales sp. PMI_506]